METDILQENGWRQDSNCPDMSQREGSHLPLPMALTLSAIKFPSEVESKRALICVFGWAKLVFS